MQRSNQPPTPAVQDLTAVVPVNKGGTGATNVSQAATNLGGINSSTLGQANGLAQMNGSGLIPQAQLPDAAVAGPTLSGSSTLSIAQIASYVISNYDSNSTYAVSCSAGTISINGDTITYTAPGTAGTYTITVAGKNFSVVVGAIKPVTPTLTMTSSGNNTAANVDMSSSAFLMAAGTSTHKSTDWEVYSDANLLNLVKSSLDDLTNKTGYGATGLALSTTYYGRCRHRAANNEVSAWSDVVSVTTKAKYVPTAEEAKIIASDKVASDAFGASVAVDSTATRIIVGANLADVSGTTDAGAVYVFIRSGVTWTLEQKISASDKAASDSFGKSVAIDADATRLAIGSYQADVSAVTDVGAVYIYLRTGTTWAFEQKIVAADRVTGDYFGWSLAMATDGSRLVSGAIRNDVSSVPDSGAAYVFSRSGTVWTQEQKIVPSDPGNTDFFGNRVTCDASCTRIAVGVRLAETGFTNSGAAYVFLRTGTTWAQEQKIIPFDAATELNFGMTVALDATGTRMVVGAPATGAGTSSTISAVYIYLRSGTVWALEQKIAPSDKGAGDQVGYWVAINATGSHVVVGSHQNDPASVSNAGAAYLFSRNGTTWNQENKYTASDKAANDGFGITVAIAADNSRVVICASDADPGGTVDAGAVYVYS